MAKPAAKSVKPAKPAKPRADKPDFDPIVGWAVDRWFNTDKPLSLPDLAGKVVVAQAFQIVCPGSISHALPQLQKIAATFSPDHVAIIGLHAGFGPADAVTADAVAAFIQAWDIKFPVGLDVSDGPNRLPRTMAGYQMRGTPSMLLFDREGRLRRHTLGAATDMQVGAEIAALIFEGSGRSVSFDDMGAEHAHHHHHDHGDHHDHGAHHHHHADGSFCDDPHCEQERR